MVEQYSSYKGLSSKRIFPIAIAILISILSVLLQGGYYIYQSSIIVICFTVLSYRQVTKASKFVIAGFLLMLCGFVISDILNSGSGFQFEILRFSCLILPFLLTDDSVKKNLLIGCYFGISFISLIGILAYFKMLPQGELAAVIDGRYRLQSIIGYANTAAVFCGIGIILGIFFRQKYKDYQFVHSVCIVLNVIALMLTFSRLGIACFVIAIMIILCFRHKTARVTFLIGCVLSLILIIVLFLVGKVGLIIGSTLASRLIYYYDGLLLLFKNPFGIGVYGWEEKQYLAQTADYYVKYIHNGYLQIALDGGILALLGFLSIICYGLLGVHRKFKECNDSFYVYLIGILVLILLHSFVDIDMSYTALLFILGIVLSFGISPSIKLNRYLLVAVSVLAIGIGISSLYIKTNINTVKFISQEYSAAYNNNDYENMYILSEQWLLKAPRQQNAYDAYFVALDKLNKTEEIKDLYKQADATNKTMNYLCKYLDKHKKITLPKVD